MKKQKGKHYEAKKKGNFKKKIKVIFVIILLISLVVTAVYLINHKDIIKSFMDMVVNTIDTTNDELPEIDREVVEAKLSNMPDKIGEYNVLGMIVIDKLGVEKNILDKTTDDSLNLSVTKFYGPNLNEVGNFCITGHNYKDVFANTNDLELDDTFYIIDKATQTSVIYKIYDKYTVNPTELDCLNQETKGKKEVTLITCNPGGLTRLIIKAQEI